MTDQLLRKTSGGDQILIETSSGEIVLNPAVEVRLKEHREAKLRAELYEGEVRDCMSEYMEANGVKSLESEEIVVRYVPGGVTNRFSGKRLKEDDPELYAEYIETSTRKSYVKMEYND